MLAAITAWTLRSGRFVEVGADGDPFAGSALLLPVPLLAARPEKRLKSSGTRKVKGGRQSVASVFGVMEMGEEGRLG